MIWTHGLLAAFMAAVTTGAVPDQGIVQQPVLTPLPQRVQPLPTAVQTPLPDAADEAARVVREARLRDTPGGRVVATIGPRTEFGSPRYLPVVRREGMWLGVIASERPNGQLGWILANHARMVREPIRVEVSLAERTLRVLDSGQTVLRMTVGVGSRSTPTPTGWFAVTDGLHGWGSYGCCILALSGHQRKLAQGWTGGDRLAVHGTTAPDTIGAASSLGCLHAGASDMRRLLRLARLGARVHITD